MSSSEKAAIIADWDRGQLINRLYELKGDIRVNNVPLLKASEEQFTDNEIRNRLVVLLEDLDISNTFLALSPNLIGKFEACAFTHSRTTYPKTILSGLELDGYIWALVLNEHGTSPGIEIMRSPTVAEKTSEIGRPTGGLHYRPSARRATTLTKFVLETGVQTAGGGHSARQGSPAYDGEDFIEIIKQFLLADSNMLREHSKKHNNPFI